MERDPMNIPTPDHPSDHEPLHPTEGVQPDPTLEEGRAGLFRVVVTLLACAGIVVLVLYGLTRPVEQPQMAASEPANSSETAPAGGGAANNAGGKTTEPNAPAQNAQPNPQKPSTTGQGSAGGQGQAGQASGPPAAGGAATGTVGGPDAKPAPAR
jgi:hypothetical protein